MKKLLFAAAALLIGSVPALAEEVPDGTLVPGAQLAQMPPPMGWNWTGFYVGINGAGVAGQTNWQRRRL